MMPRVKPAEPKKVSDSDTDWTTPISTSKRKHTSEEIRESSSKRRNTSSCRSRSDSDTFLRSSNTPKSIAKGVGEYAVKQHSQVKQFSKRKSILPRRRTVSDSHSKSQYMLHRYGNLEKVTQSVYKDIKYYQETTRNLIPALPFSRLLREILGQYANGQLRIQTTALQCIHEASELFLVDLFIASNLVASHARRKTVMKSDMELVLYLTDLGKIK